LDFEKDMFSEKIFAKNIKLKKEFSEILKEAEEM
jgi:hypothetical protein